MWRRKGAPSAIQEGVKVEAEPRFRLRGIEVDANSVSEVLERYNRDPNAAGEMEHRWMQKHPEEAAKMLDEEGCKYWFMNGRLNVIPEALNHEGKLLMGAQNWRSLNGWWEGVSMPWFDHFRVVIVEQVPRDTSDTDQDE